MKLLISDKRKISAIQEEFNQLFPFLKIDFFQKLHKPRRDVPKSQIKLLHKTISEFRSTHKNGTLTVIPSMTVTELEKKLNETFGLSAQVFRKSGNVWLKTTVTDCWTLEEQNKQGEELCKNFSRK